MKKSMSLSTLRYESFSYELNPQTQYFRKISGGSMLPEELRVEPVRVEEKYKYAGVSEILTSRQVQNVTAFKTGLQKCSDKRNFFSGDIDEGNSKKTLVAIAFSLDKTQLRIFLFRGFWITFPKFRLKCVNEFLTNFFNQLAK